MSCAGRAACARCPAPPLGLRRHPTGCRPLAASAVCRERSGPRLSFLWAAISMGQRCSFGFGRSFVKAARSVVGKTKIEIPSVLGGPPTGSGPRSSIVFLTWKCRSFAVFGRTLAQPAQSIVGKLKIEVPEALVGPRRGPGPSSSIFFRDRLASSRGPSTEGSLRWGRP